MNNSALQNPISLIPDYKNKGIDWPTSTIAQPAPADGVWCAPFITYDDAPIVYVDDSPVVGTGGQGTTGCGIGAIPVKKGQMCRWSQGGGKTNQVLSVLMED